MNELIDIQPRNDLIKDIVKNEIVVSLVVGGDPESKQRPRLGKGRTYTPTKTKKAETALGWELKRAHSCLLPDENQQFAVFIAFYTASYQRRDVDNMSKLVLDACTGIIWKDDSQVKELHCYVERQDPNPRTEIIIWGTGLAMRSLKKCRVCKKLYESYPKRLRYTARYCSTNCQMIAQKTGIEINCIQCGKFVGRAQYAARKGKGFFCSKECKDAYYFVELKCDSCGKTFIRKRAHLKKGRKFCSPECNANYYRERRKVSAQGTCSVCGGVTTKKTYERCQACFIKSGRFRNNKRCSTGREKVQ